MLDPDVTIAMAYANRQIRGVFFAMFELDATLGRVVAAAREPMVGQIKLAWWRDALVELQSGKSLFAEPVLQGVADAVDTRSLGLSLSAMVEGWGVLLEPTPLSRGQLAIYADHRGGTLFAALSHLAGQSDAGCARSAGSRWALSDFAFRCSDAPTANTALAMVNEGSAPNVIIRPLAILGRFATRDCALGLGNRPRPGSPVRMLWALRQALFNG